MNEDVIYDSLRCILQMLETIIFIPENMKDDELKDAAHKYIESTIKEINEVQK